MSDVTIRVTGVGQSQEITIEPGSSLEDALAAANIDAEAAGLDVEVNGSAADSPSETTVQDGDQVVTTPKNVKLG